MNELILTAVLLLALRNQHLHSPKFLRTAVREDLSRVHAQRAPLLPLRARVHDQLSRVHVDLSRSKVLPTRVHVDRAAVHVDRARAVSLVHAAKHQLRATAEHP